MLTTAPSTTFTAEERVAFEQDGYVIVRQMADESVVRRMVEVTQDHVRRRVEPIEYEADLQYPGAPTSRDANGGATPRRLKQAHARDAVFTEWLQQPVVVGRLKELLGSPLYCPLAHHNCVMTKQPQFSSQTGWHQDIRYWSFTDRNLVNVWLALGSERPENGCLQVIPSTHLMTFSADRLDSDLFLRTDLPDNQELIDSAVNVELSAGDVLFFHCRTFHSAGANKTNETKLSVVFTYRGDGNPPLAGTRSASLPEMLIHV